MAKRALLVGIDEYEHFSCLSACAADARAIRDLLARNYDGSPNYDCRLLVSPGTKPITRKFLREQWLDLFGAFRGDVLFYFAGHGTPTKIGGFLVTEEGECGDPGLPMEELLALANTSAADSILLILDCCYSGIIANQPVPNGEGNIHAQAHLRQGLTILAATSPTQRALEVSGHGVFTRLLLGALSGGAADVRGRVSEAAIYAYMEQALGSWDQRPMYKSHADQLPPVRLCEPAVSDAHLRELSAIWDQPEAPFQMDPSFEFTHPSAKPENVALFNRFKILRDARLLVPEERKDLYFTALQSGNVRLTPLGQFYWHLARLGRL